MAPLDIPEGGLVLQREGRPSGLPADSVARPTQIMRLNLAQSTLEELVESLRNGQKARIRLGKHQMLHYGTKSQSFFSSPETSRSELYTYSPADKENVYFSGVLSHNLEVQKAQEATAATDEALANLEQSLSAFERGKESKKTPMITTIDEMRALGAGDNRTATGREAATLARMPTSRIDVEKERFFKNAANRSTPASPALLAAHSPTSISALAPTSAPLTMSKDKIRLEALRVPLIHLLAIRSVSVKFLARQTRSSQEDCLSLVRKYGTENRLNREKFNLKDKAYKDLNVWDFPFPSQEDRQAAIDNAISAFDRMRLSRHDKLWQMLLPKHERGKGKILSRLNLCTGPITKSVTPRVRVQGSEDTLKEGFATGNESDMTNGGVSPSPGDLVPSPRLGNAMAKKRAIEKSALSKRGPSKPKNTTLTGKVTKKTDKKPDRKLPTKTDSKFKSAEFVRDSDEEDDEMVEANVSTPPIAKTFKGKRDWDIVKMGKKPTQRIPPTSVPKVVESGPNNSATRTQSSKTLPSTIATSRAANSNSPPKPSPLGSSPPTNASDLDNSTRSSNTSHSSSSSSPLIAQVRRQKSGPPGIPRSLSSNAANGGSKSPTLSNPLKRKAETDLDVESTHNTSHEIERVQALRHVKSRTLSTAKSNGHVAELNRRRSSSSSSGSTAGSASPPLPHQLLRQRLREKSQLFKLEYAEYLKLHEEMTTHPHPPRSKLEKLEWQHVRLQKMKKEIWDEDRRLGGG
jgi:RNA polymerase II elongation factor ELL